MKAQAIKLFAIISLCLVSMVIAQEQKKQPQDQLVKGISLSEIREYRKMIRVNEKPIDMVEQTKLMCALPLFVFGPHYDPGVVYYINEVTQQGIKSFSETKQFPVGAIVIKEKQEKKNEDSVQIITVMKKIRSGKGEDSWEYKMYDVKKWAEVVYEKGKDNSFTKTCLGCHRHYKDNDYISSKGMELFFKK